MEQKRRTNVFIGSAIERVEDLRLLRSSVAHGRIRSIDATAARARPGVHAVITAAELGAAIPTIPLRQDSSPAFGPFEQPVIAHDKVRYVGEPIAIVLAETAAAAEDALDAISVDIDPLPAVVATAGALTDEILLFEAARTNRPLTLSGVRGDADGAFKDAPYVRREKFAVQRHGAVPMEPRGLLAEWDAARGTLTVFGAAKVAFLNRRILAKQMQLPESAIRMVENDVGGGFGARGEFYPEDFLIPFAARFTGRPVKWIEDRREHLAATNHAREAECELEIACNRDGTIRALRGHALTDQGAYIRTNGPTAARNIAQVLSGPYRIPHIHIDVSLLMTNKTPAGTYRGPGRFEADFFRERLFDLAAAELGLDPVEFRRCNLLSEAEMPHRLATVEPLAIESETDSGDYAMTLARCLKEIDWTAKAAMQGKLVEGRYRGTAIGCYLEGGASGPKENARLAIESDGKISVYVGSSSIGQGLETVCAQIAADALEIPMDEIKGVFHGSTDHVSDGCGSYSSRAVVMGGNAIVGAAAKLRDAVRAAAAERWGCPAKEVNIDAGAVRGPNQGLRPKARTPATSAPTATARTPPTSPSIRRRATCSFSIMWRSRTPGASSTR
jgi:carbon-monoxide dehydrogenase large subunit